MMEMKAFWLPKDIAEEVLKEKTLYEEFCFRDGRACSPNSEDAVIARSPKLNNDQWQKLIELLIDNRERVPQSENYWLRLESALKIVSKKLADPQDSLSQQLLRSVPRYTGFSDEMIRFSMRALDLVNLTDLPKALQIKPTWQSTQAWQRMASLQGWLRFYPKSFTGRMRSFVPFFKHHTLFSSIKTPRLITGYAAGNVPGTALLIAILSQTANDKQSIPPAILIRNSRREPIFSAAVLSAIEAIDPDLFANTAVLVWDYDNQAIQNLILRQADLLIAAASDETIDQIREQQKRVKSKSRSRLHAHGHKVSFSVISKTVLQLDLTDPNTNTTLLDIITRLAGLDSIVWDQFGCLSARIHFVEQGNAPIYSPLDYAHNLNTQLKALAQYLPRGIWSRSQLHNLFDRYKALEANGKVQVFSNYNDEFLVVLDSRELSQQLLFQQINECQGRVIIIKPVSNLMEIPESYLSVLPPQNLQSLSVAMGYPGEAFTQEELEFLHQCASCGVTAIRSVGRGAFPQLAYSWDGMTPLDLLYKRPTGYFSTLEFEKPFEHILDTYKLLEKKD
jgi:hypothetical protein